MTRSHIPYTRDRTLAALGADVPMARLNLDGALGVRNVSPQGETHGYAQFFRNGFFETVKTLAFRDYASLGGIPPTAGSLRLEELQTRASLEPICLAETKGVDINTLSQRLVFTAR